MYKSISVGLTAGALLVGAGTAQMGIENDPKIVATASGLSGLYIFDTTEAAFMSCVVNLEPVGSYNQFRVWLAPGCEGQYPVLGVVTGWEPLGRDGVKLIGAEGSTFGEFKMTADGSMQANVVNDGKAYKLMPAPQQ